MLDLSRGLRMSDRKLPIPPSALCERIDVDAAPADSVCERASVIYFGSAQQVSHGFAIALHAMGFEAGILPSVQHDITSNPEDS
jgi:hypothetical protein